MLDEILFETRGMLAIVTLNRPAALNAQNLAMVEAFARQLQRWEDDPTITRLLIQGTGGKAFCAGGDVKALWTQPEARRLAFFTHEYELCAALKGTRLETIAYLDGITMGGGVGLSIYAAHRVATPQTRWAMPEAKIGFFLDIAASHFLNHVTAPALGRYLALTGGSLDGAACLAAGIATAYVAAGQGAVLAARLAAQLANGAPVTQILAALAIDTPTANLPQFDDTAITLPLSAFAAMLQQRGLWPADGCAFSLAVIDAALERGRTQRYEETVAMDKVLVRHFLAGTTFPEGVRARLIDRDQQPDWGENALASVDFIEVRRFFTDC